MAAVSNAVLEAAWIVPFLLHSLPVLAEKAGLPSGVLDSVIAFDSIHELG
jgi:hypothetical protein